MKKVVLFFLSFTMTSCFILNVGCKKDEIVISGESNSLDVEPNGPDVEIATPDTWAAVDELGRNISDGAIPKQEDRTVLMFYFLAKDPFAVTPYPYPVNVTEVQEQYPEALNVYDHPAWGNLTQSCYWNRPLFGYYRTTDPWVLRKHAEMLADAGVDAIVFDCSPGMVRLFEHGTDSLMTAWTRCKEDGVKVPKIAYMFQFSANQYSLPSLRNLYNRLYKPGNFKDLWYYKDGKPLVLAYPDNLTDSEEDVAIRNFFTFRPIQPHYRKGPVRPDQWGWLESAPQHLFANEEMPVGVAQNATDYTGGACDAFNAPDSYGRSYTKANGHDRSEKAYVKGLNFQEQWDRAIETKPKYVFVTGWNEWTAGRRLNYAVRPELPFSMLDQFDNEGSRDIEPTSGWGDHGDNYYYQLVQNIRRYKGVGKAPRVSEEKTVEIGAFKGWNNVSPDYKHYPGNTFHRNCEEFSKQGVVYKNTTGRNDLVDARVARDKDYIYFYIQTKLPITAFTSKAWMRLYINIDRKHETGWKGYDYMLNYKTPESKEKGYISKFVGNSWDLQDAGTFEYAVKANKLELKVSKKDLGVSGKLDFEFKWCDNVRTEDDVLSFYLEGDSAPGGRFNFVFTEP